MAAATEPLCGLPILPASRASMARRLRKPTVRGLKRRRRRHIQSSRQRWSAGKFTRRMALAIHVHSNDTILRPIPGPVCPTCQQVAIIPPLFPFPLFRRYTIERNSIPAYDATFDSRLTIGLDIGALIALQHSSWRLPGLAGLRALKGPFAARAIVGSEHEKTVLDTQRASSPHRFSKRSAIERREIVPRGLAPLDVPKPRPLGPLILRAEVCHATRCQILDPDHLRQPIES